IVAKDETEAGLRALLNLGHTFGHAIEAQMGYGNWLHGEAVAAGMMIAANLACQRGALSTADVEKIRRVIALYQLPTEAPSEMSAAQFLQHMRKDKKNKQGKIR
ncbi:3-dehydroquinate synthase, partial [Pseudoalteromonas sp. S1941]